MAAPASNRQPATVAEVREIIAALIVEKNHLLHANDPAAAEAIGLAIEYWQAVLAKTPDDRRQPTHPKELPRERAAGSVAVGSGAAAAAKRVGTERST